MAAAFDMIGAAGFGYRTGWAERRYLARLAAVPLIVKFACYLLVLKLGWHDNFFRQALVMLPSYFADGWMLSHIVRLVFFGQRWPFRPSGDAQQDMAALRERAQGITAGTVCFVLINFLLAGVIAIAWKFGSGITDAQAAQPSAALSLAVIAAIALGFWGFRYLWFFIPAAAGYPLRRFDRSLRGFSGSLPLLGVWLAFLLPLFAVFQFIAGMMAQPYGGLEHLPPSVDLAGSFILIVMDLARKILATIGIAYGIRAVIGAGENRKI